MASVYLRRGARVLITDNNGERGERCVGELPAAGELHFLRADTRSDEDWNLALNWCRQHWDGLDTLVNNAGVAAAGRFERIDLSDWEWIIGINLQGVVRGCHHAVPLFKTQRRGRIINIASLAAIASAAGMSSYNVTKAGVVSLSETLRHELAPYGISVTVACPSFFRTNLGESLRSPEPGMEKAVGRLLEGGRLNAGQVAERIIQAAGKGRFMVLPDREGALLWRLKRYLPFLHERMAARLGRRFKVKLEGGL
jgi:NAD(P)-dependent dehydrogenase (short-subunit alcohol dehydrogenase family)